MDVYVARRFGTVGHRFTGVLYEVELPRPFPFLHLAPKGWPTYPRDRWPFFFDLFWLSAILLVLLSRLLAGYPILKPGTSSLLLIFPTSYFYLFTAWKGATMGVGSEVALEGELARRFRAWGEVGSIRQDTPLGRVLLEIRRARWPFWLRVEDRKLYLAFPASFFPMNPLLSSEKVLAREKDQIKWELKAIEELLRALEELRPEANAQEEHLTQDPPLSG